MRYDGINIGFEKKNNISKLSKREKIFPKKQAKQRNNIFFQFYPSIIDFTYEHRRIEGSLVSPFGGVKS